MDSNGQGRAWRTGLRLALGGVAVLGATLGGGCAVEVGQPSEPVALEHEAFNNGLCVQALQTGCWEQRDNSQTFAFSHFEPAASGTRVQAHATGPKTVFFHGKNWLIGYMSHPAGLPSDARSMTAASPEGKSGTVHVLSADSVTRVATGDLTKLAGALDEVQFARWTMFVDAKKSDGAALCMSKIELVRVPSPSSASFNLIGVSCDGKLYHAKNGRWAPASEHAGLKDLPTNVSFREVARLGSSGGATFLTSTGDVWLGMRGSYDFRAGIKWTAPTKLPAIMNGANTLKATHVGGRYAITNAGNGTCPISCANGSCTSGFCSGDGERFYKYDIATNKWSRAVPVGVPWYPDTVDDYGKCTGGGNFACWSNAQCSAGNTCTLYTPYWVGVQEVGSTLVVNHRFSWPIRWRP